jgi:hypothetical protein
LIRRLIGAAIGFLAATGCAAGFGALTATVFATTTRLVWAIRRGAKSMTTPLVAGRLTGVVFFATLERSLEVDFVSALAALAALTALSSSS